jgi:hypothetical protein
VIIYDWPAILVANAETFRIDARTRSGGETIQGREQVISSGLGRWIARLTVPLHTPAKIRAARALLAKLDGRTNAVRVGPCDCRNGNQISPAIGHIPYAPTGAFHSPTGAGFSIGGQVPKVSVAALVGAFQVQIDVASTMMPLLDGSFIGLGGYLYTIIGATDMPGEEALLDIRPRLRTELEEGDPVEWCHARLPMRLQSDDSGAFELQLARAGTATFDLVEVF